MSGIASLIMLNLDSPNPAEHANFYHEVLGWDVTYSDDNYAMLSDGTSTIGFGRAEGYEPPPWHAEGTPKRYHLDLRVEDLAKAEAKCLEMGATKPDFQPNPERWRVLLDPAGHPFCLCPPSTD